MGVEKKDIKSLEQRKADLDNRKATLEQKKKELGDKVKADEQKKKKFYLIGLGAAVLGFILMSFSTILGIIVVAAGIGFIVFLNKKGEILLKNNNEDLKKLIEEEAQGIAADEAAIKEEEEAERKRIEKEECKRKEEEERKRKEEEKRKREEERKRKEEELKRQKAQIESEEKGIYGSGCNFSAKALVDRKENLENIESYFDVDGNLGIDKKVGLINSAKESVKDLVTSSNINEIMCELESIAAILSIDTELAFAKRVADIRTALATLTKTEELLAAELDGFDPNGKTLDERVTTVVGLQRKYNVDSSLPAEEQVSKIKASIKEEEERRCQEEERRRRAAELKQKAAQIQKEIDAIYGVVEAKFGYVSKLLLEGKMKKLEEFESFFGVDSSLDVDKKIALMQTSCEKIKALGINEPTMAKLKSAFIKHAESLGVASNLKFNDMLAGVKG